MVKGYTKSQFITYWSKIISTLCSILALTNLRQLFESKARQNKYSDDR